MSKTQLTILLIFIGIFAFIVGLNITNDQVTIEKDGQTLGSVDINELENPVNGSVEVSTATSTQVRSFDSGRKYCEFHSVDNQITLCYANSCTWESGHMVSAGGVHIIVPHENLWRGVISAIATSSTSTVSFICD